MRKPGVRAIEETLRGWCREAISMIMFGDNRILNTLPANASGKIIKGELKELF